MQPRADIVDDIRGRLTSEPRGYSWWQRRLKETLGLKPTVDAVRDAMEYLFKRKEAYYKPHCGWQVMPPGLKMYYRTGEELARRNK